MVAFDLDQVVSIYTLSHQTEAGQISLHSDYGQNESTCVVKFVTLQVMSCCVPQQRWVMQEQLLKHSHQHSRDRKAPSSCSLQWTQKSIGAGNLLSKNIVRVK